MPNKKSNKCFLGLENIYKGKTLYIIGNGPSLAETNLSLIKDSPSIAMNRISLLYPKFNDWLPTYYIFCSSNITNPIWGGKWAESVKEALSKESTISFIDERCKNFLVENDFKLHKNVRIINSLTENKPEYLGKINKKSFSLNIIESIDKAGSTINVALQLAYFMGAEKIIFLGTDLGWTANNGRKNDNNHFDKSYRAHIPDPVKANIQMRNVHILANRIFQKNKPNVKLYNASKFTKLDVYPIIEFEDYAKNGNIKEKKQLAKEAYNFWKKIKPGNKYLIIFRQYLYKIKEKIIIFLKKMNCFDRF